MTMFSEKALLNKGGSKSFRHVICEGNSTHFPGRQRMMFWGGGLQIHQWRRVKTFDSPLCSTGLSY